MITSPVGSTRSRLRLGVAIITLLTLLVSPAAADPGIPGGTFTDDDGNVHEGYIEAIAAAGITRGCNPPSNYYYCPGEPVTRGQMAAFLTRALDLSRATADNFSDDRDSVYESDINALAAAGITRGCNPPANTRFCPDQPVTRGQMAAFLVRAFNFTARGGTNNFGDDDGSIFEGDIDRLAAAGITRGCDPPSNARYCPEAPVLRDQMATFLARSLGLDPTTPPPAGNRRVIASDTMIEDERLVLRPGDSLEFRNGARLMIGGGASVDWQGSPTTTWSDDGKVQNLRRDVRIFGRGDIMFMKGSQPSTIRYVEVDLQPLEEVGHYPLHWHLVGDGARGTLVEGVVVKHSTNHAYVPHGSHGITFRDTIAMDTTDDAYWYDPGDETNDLVYDHVLADGVVNPGNNRMVRLTAFWLGMGRNNVIRDSVALNVTPWSPKSCSGFHWPEKNGSNWIFENNASLGSSCYGIFWWQNNSADKVVDGFRGDGILHGAYVNKVTYRNVDVADVRFSALSWRMEDSIVRGNIHADWHSSDGGPVVFSNVEIGGRFIITDANQNRNTPGVYIFDSTNLTCGDVVWENALAESSVRINGHTCSQ